MSAFRQHASGEFNTRSMPTVTKIARKPEGVGAEFKTIADPCSGAMLGIELQEGKLAMRAKEKCAELGAGASCTWRLTKPWHGTGRTTKGDSWFGSLKCSIALMLVGLYGCFMVKTAHRCFPLQYFKAWAAAEEDRVDDQGNPIPWGNHKVLRHTKHNPNGPDHVFYALAHRDRRLKTIVTNKGTTLPGQPMSVERSRLVYDEEGGVSNEYYLKTTPRTKMMELLFDDFSVIDIGNRWRQGILRPEKYWLTKCWWKRCFTTVGMGMCVVDAFLVYKYEFQTFHMAGLPLEFLDFVGKLAYKLINNIWLEDGVAVRAAATPPGGVEQQQAERQVCIVFV